MYYLIYTYPRQVRVHVMHGADDKVIMAEPGNEHLLLDMGRKLKEDNIIGMYQLVRAVGIPE